MQQRRRLALNMVSKNTLHKKIITRVVKSSVTPKAYKNPKERTDIIEPLDDYSLLMKLLKEVEEKRESGNRTGKKRNRLLKRIKRMKGFIDKA